MFAADWMSTAATAATGVTASGTPFNSAARFATAMAPEVVATGACASDWRWIATIAPDTLESAEKRTAGVATLALEVPTAIARIGAGRRVVNPFVVVFLATSVARIATS